MAHEISRRSVLKGTALLGLTGGALLGPATSASAAAPAAWTHGPGIAARWVRTAYAVVAAGGLTPPSAARAYALGSIAAYEALLPGMPEHRSLGGQLTGLRRLPPPPAGTVDWPLVLNAAWATALRGLFPAMADGPRAAVVARQRAEVADRQASGVSYEVARASRQHGSAVARAVLSWARDDGHAEAMATPYTPPVGESAWVPTPPNFGTAIEPHCAQVRPMVLRTTDEVAPAAPVPYSSEPGSPFFEQAMAVYRQSSANTDETRDIARFWTDNPVFSGLPAGHWMSIVVQVAEQQRLGLDEAVEALAVTGVALHDAFLNCWTWKYRHNLLRPVTYVRRHIDPEWSTWVNTPQFPEFTSGHSVASRAASTVLTELLGPVGFADTSLATTNGMSRRTRRFSDFHAAADMAAQSRLYGGIHYPMGIELGKAQGDRVGALVLQRVTTRRAALL